MSIRVRMRTQRSMRLLKIWRAKPMYLWISASSSAKITKSVIASCTAPKAYSEPTTHVGCEKSASLQTSKSGTPFLSIWNDLVMLQHQHHSQQLQSSRPPQRLSLPPLQQLATSTVMCNAQVWSRSAHKTSAAMMVRVVTSCVLPPTRTVRTITDAKDQRSRLAVVRVFLMDQVHHQALRQVQVQAHRQALRQPHRQAHSLTQLTLIQLILRTLLLFQDHLHAPCVHEM
jgi:hypothetical protein